jgi:hypothetical protein
MVLVSLIMGLGITVLLDGAVNVLRADTKIRPGLIHGLWVLILLLQHVSVWLVRWRASSNPEWTGFEVLFFLLIPVLLFALARLAFPGQSREVNLTSYFMENRLPFFGLQALMVIGYVFGPMVYFEGGTQADQLGLSNLWFLALILWFGLLAWSSNRRFHLASAVFVLLVWSYSFRVITL